MPSLAETQWRVRDAVVASSYEAVSPLIVGGTDPARRLAIHRRHYHASLVDVLRSRFPATAWLIGDEAVTTAAAAFVVEHPPRVFCMAELGEPFPAFLAARPGLTSIAYLEDFATLEWHVGRASVAVSSAPLAVEWLRTCDPDVLPSLRLTLQPGVSYLRPQWSVDAVMHLYLSDQAPDAFTIRDGDRPLEVRGARGDVTMTPLPLAEWTFRREIAAGRDVESAADTALDADPSCDPGSALVHLLAAGLVTGARPTR